MEVVGIVVAVIGPVFAVWQWLRAEKLSKQLEEAEKRAEVRHQEILDLQAVLTQLPEEAIGDKVGVYRDLPPDTRVVALGDGRSHIVLPVRLKTNLRTEGRGTVKVRVDK